MKEFFTFEWEDESEGLGLTSFEEMEEHLSFLSLRDLRKYNDSQICRWKNGVIVEYENVEVDEDGGYSFSDREAV